MAGQVARVTIFGTTHGQTVNICPHFEYVSPADDFNAFVETIRTQFIAAITPCLNNTVVWNRVDIKPVHTNTIATFSKAITPTAGVVGDNGLGVVITYLLGLQTGQAARTKRGRLYVPGPYATGAWQTGLTQADHITKWATAIGLLKTRFIDQATGGLRLVVWSRKLSEMTYVTNIVLRSQFGVQRRRKPGVGI